jgi:N-acetyl-gamma-glutamylphosphate reductase
VQNLNLMFGLGEDEGLGATRSRAPEVVA